VQTTPVHRSDGRVVVVDVEVVADDVVVGRVLVVVG